MPFTAFVYFFCVRHLSQTANTKVTRQSVHRLLQEGGQQDKDEIPEKCLQKG